jgi:hypothetical protein
MNHLLVTQRYVRAAAEKQLPETLLLSFDRFDNVCRFFCLRLLHGREAASFGATANLRSFLSHWVFLSWQICCGDGGRPPAHH